MKKLITTVCFLFLCMNGVMYGQLITQENDGLTTGNLGTQDSWVQNGSGTDVQVANASPITYDGYAGGDDEYLTTTNANGIDPHHTFTSQGSTTRIWYSFLLNVTSATSTGEYFVTLRNTANTTYLSRLFIKDSASAFRLGISRGSASAFGYTGAFTYGTTYLVICRYDWSTTTTSDDAMYLWVNPTITSEPSTGSANLTHTGGTDPSFGSAINSIMIHQRGVNCPVSRIDGIRLSANSNASTGWTSLDCSPANYYSKSSGNLNSTSSWGHKTNGKGSRCPNFTDNNRTYNIRNNATPTLGASWTVSGTSSKVVTGDGTNACTFTVPSGSPLSGTIDVSNSATLVLQDNTAPTFGTLNSGSTVQYDGAGAQSIPATTFGHLSVSNTGGSVTASGTVTVLGTATIATSATLTMGANNLTGSGGSAAFAGTGTISLDAIAQVSGFSNNFGGTYYLTGANPNVPTGTYAGLSVNGGGATMTGDVTVSGTLNLNGTFNVGANTLTISNPLGVTPTNLVTTSASSLVINGTAGSIVIPNTVTALTNLTINNSSLVTANAGITVSGTFTLGLNGFILDMGGNTLEIGTSTAVLGAITRTGSGSVRGPIKRWFSTASTTGLFPLNNGATDYVGATINFSVNPTTGGSITASYTTTGAGSIPGGFIDFGAQNPGVNLINISPQFWTIDDNDGLAGFTYGVDLEANNMGISTTGSNYLFTAILKRNTGGGNTWAWNNANHVTTQGPGTNPIVRGAGFTTFSDFAIGGNNDNPLPVELSSFTSAVSGTNVTLNWSTGFEQNNSGFDIERKSTVGSWSKIGNVAGHGTISTTSNYTYSDRNLASGKYSYRLKQIDFNGNYKYYDLSNEVIIGTPSKYALSQNYPNPFNPSTSISYEIPTSNFVSLKIYDMMGKEVASLVSGNQEAGFYTVKFDASKLSSGIYFYKLQANDFTATKKLMLLK